MTSSNAAERPNRMVTCPVCKGQMPRRFLGAHLKTHDQAGEKALEGMAEIAPAVNEAPAPVVAVETDKERAGMRVCPACAVFVAEGEFAMHMQAQHLHWCPMCHAQTKNLTEHLHRIHLVKPVQPVPLYEGHWETQKRFFCLGCRRKVSVASYPSHAVPHGATKGPGHAPQGEKE